MRKEKYKLLIVDDTEVNRKLLKRILSDYEIVEAENGIQAVELLKENKDFDLVLMDLLMPEMNGFKTLEEMKRNGIMDNQPIMVISAETTSDCINKAFELGAIDYITRPFETGIVNRRVKNTCRFYEKQKKLLEELQKVNQKQIDILLKVSDDSVATYRLNLTKNTCELGSSKAHDLLDEGGEQTASGLLEAISRYFINEEEKAEFKEKFRIEELLDNYYRGNKNVTMIHSYQVSEDRRANITSSINMYHNTITKEIEGILYMFDTSYVNMENMIHRKLLAKEYESIGIIDAETGQFMLYSQTEEFDEMCEENRKKIKIDYEKHCESTARKYVVESEQEIFIKNTRVANIVSQLDENKEYFFTIKCPTPDGRKLMKKFSFFYLDESRNHIITAMEDITVVLEQDILTGALNRRGFIAHVRKILNENKEEKYAILYFNIKGFKAINEMHGMTFGDALLRGFPSKIEKTKLSPVKIARTEADRFVCLVKQENIDYEELVNLLHSRYENMGNTINIDARCGIYMIDDISVDIENMCDMAKIAKDNIVDGYSKPYLVYDKNMKDNYMSKVLSSLEMESALERHEIVPYYQPVYDAKTEKIVSAEALVRWKHSELGMISPGSFIPALEENGQISKVDMEIVKNVKQFIIDRIEKGKFVVPVSTNLSGMDFYDTAMMEGLKREMDSRQWSDGYCRFEVTETSYASVADDNLKTLSSLKNSGATILIDDFGSGYSSFSTLSNYDFDILKLDMGFVRKIGKCKKSEQVIRSVIEMVHNMDIKVIAEGAETREQVDFLRDNDCDYIQGYYFSKPLPQDEFEKLLDSQGQS